jgi:hypothetical protein
VIVPRKKAVVLERGNGGGTFTLVGKTGVRKDGEISLLLRSLCETDGLSKMSPKARCVELKSPLRL